MAIKWIGSLLGIVAFLFVFAVHVRWMSCHLCAGGVSEPTIDRADVLRGEVERLRGREVQAHHEGVLLFVVYAKYDFGRLCRKILLQIFCMFILFPSWSVSLTLYIVFARTELYRALVGEDGGGRCAASGGS